MTAPVLPELERPCEHCTGEIGDAMRRENNAEWQAWRVEESAAFAEFAADHERNNRFGNAAGVWHHAPWYLELWSRRPEELPEAGCIECDWTSVQLTDAGRQVLDLVRRHS